MEQKQFFTERSIYPWCSMVESASWYGAASLQLDLGIYSSLRIVPNTNLFWHKTRLLDSWGWRIMSPSSMIMTKSTNQIKTGMASEVVQHIHTHTKCVIVWRALSLLSLLLVLLNPLPSPSLCLIVWTVASVIFVLMQLVHSDPSCIVTKVITDSRYATS